VNLRFHISLFESKIITTLKIFFADVTELPENVIEINFALCSFYNTTVVIVFIISQ